MRHNVPSESDDQSLYECLQCGDIIKSEKHPGTCEECGGELQDRGMSLE